MESTPILSPRPTKPQHPAINPAQSQAAPVSMALLPSRDQVSSTSLINPALPTPKTCPLTRPDHLESTSLEPTKAEAELDLESIRLAQVRASTKLAQAQVFTKAEPAQLADQVALPTKVERPTKAEPTNPAQAEPTKPAQPAQPERPTKPDPTNPTNPVPVSPAAPTKPAPTAPQQPAQQPAAQPANQALVNTNPPTNTRRNEQ